MSIPLSYYIYIYIYIYIYTHTCLNIMGVITLYIFMISQIMLNRLVPES